VTAYAALRWTKAAAHDDDDEEARGDDDGEPLQGGDQRRGSAILRGTPRIEVDNPNEKISRTTNQAATDQETTKRKDELNDELKMLAEQEKEFDKQVRRHCHSIETFPTHVLSILHILFGQ
jgi:hypothetical protein